MCLSLRAVGLPVRVLVSAGLKVLAMVEEISSEFEEQSLGGSSFSVKKTESQQHHCLVDIDSHWIGSKLSRPVRRFAEPSTHDG